MIKEIVICDKCGKVIDSGKDINILEKGIVKNPHDQKSGDNPFAGKHFCNQCFTKIEDFICVPEVQRSGQIKVSEKDKKYILTTELDLGKIAALAEAGWTSAKIADDLKVDSRIIKDALHQYKVTIEKETANE